MTSSSPTRPTTPCDSSPRGADGPPSYDANDVYTLAGTGTAGTGGDSAQATGSELDAPQGVVFDAAGDEYIADTAANRVQEIAASDRTQWGVTMTAGDVYTIAGSASGTSGFSGDGAAATSSKLAAPMALAFDSAATSTSLTITTGSSARSRRRLTASGASR